MTAYVNIGSNKGNRRENLSRAIALLDFPGLRVSETVETAPWGFESSRSFLNVGVAFETDLGPEALLLKLLEIQNTVDPSPHRDASGAYIDRAVDIDLVAVDDLVVETPALTLPHPRMHLRDFVLIPMAELAPDWRHPLLRKTAASLLEAFRP